MAQQPAIDPMHQFLIHKIVDLPPVHLGSLVIDMSITNSVFAIEVARHPVALLIRVETAGQRPWISCAEPQRMSPVLFVDHHRFLFVCWTSRPPRSVDERAKGHASQD